MTTPLEHVKQNGSKQTKTMSHLNAMATGPLAGVSGGRILWFNMAIGSYFSRNHVFLTDQNELKRLTMEFYRRKKRENSSRYSIDRSLFNALRYLSENRLGLLGKSLINKGAGWLRQFGHGREMVSWSVIEKSMWLTRFQRRDKVSGSYGWTCCDPDGPGVAEVNPGCGPDPILNETRDES